LIPLYFKDEKNFLNLSDIFSGNSTNIFIDEFHISEYGNDIAAGKAVEKILPTLNT
jgi:hypothetical protein